MAGDKKDVRYIGGILRKWYTKGYKTARDVLAAQRDTMQNVQPAALPADGCWPAGPGAHPHSAKRRRAAVNNEELTRKALSIVAGRRQRAVTLAGQRAPRGRGRVPRWRTGTRAMPPPVPPRPAWPPRAPRRTTCRPLWPG